MSPCPTAHGSQGSGRAQGGRGAPISALHTWSRQRQETQSQNSGPDLGFHGLDVFVFTDEQLLTTTPQNT